MTGGADGDLRHELVKTVAQLLDGTFATDEAVDEALTFLKARVPHPRMSDLIFWPRTEFDHDPTADEIVDRALSYRAVNL